MTEKRCCPVMSEQFQFETDRYKFTRCTGCGNWSGHYKEGVTPMEHDDIDMSLEIFVHLGLVERVSDEKGEEQFRMTAKGHKFKPGVHPEV